jgi:mannosyltransferase OCH1-like enzyme/tetratricopeptide (TPR) repeat protein
MLKRLRVLHDCNRLDAAEAAFRSILDEVPGHAYALMGLGLCAYLRGHPVEAIDALRDVVATHPNQPDFIIELARLVMEVGDLAGADAVFALLPDNYDAQMERGKLARRQGQTETALAHFKTAALLSPQRPPPLAERAATLRGQGRFAEAVLAAKAILALEPRHAAEGYRLLGSIHRRSGERAAALAAFTEAAILRPEEAHLLVEMAQEEQALGRPRAATILLSRALMLDANCLPALLMLSEQERTAGQPEKALDLVRQALATRENDPSLHLRLVRSLRELNFLAEAEAVMLSAEARFGKLPDLQVGRIDMLREDGFWHQAQAIVRSARVEASDYLPLWERDFALTLLLGSNSEVRACLAQASRRSIAETIRVLHGEVLLAEREGRMQDALRHGDAAIELDPNYEPLLRDLTRLRLLDLDLDKARHHLRSLAAIEASRRILRGSSINASQSFLGKLWNEYAIDQEGLSALSAVKTLPAGEHSEALLALVAKRPDHIPTSIALLRSLRIDGSFDAEAELVAEAHSPIPKVIAQYWDAVEPPLDLMALHRSWGEHNPGFEQRLFSHETALQFLQLHYPPAVALAYARSTKVQTRADLFRLAYLAREGGYWADMDDRCTAPVSQIIPPWAKAVFWQERWGTLDNIFMAAMPSSSVLTRALELSVKAVNRGDGERPWFSTGPGLLSCAFTQVLISKGSTWRNWLRDQRILDRYDLYQAVAPQCRTSHKKGAKPSAREMRRAQHGLATY